MNLQEITLPEVVPMAQRARFYKDDKERNMIEISFAGSKDTNVTKVNPEHMAQFREEWNAFCDGLPPKQRGGTPLTEVMDEVLAKGYVDKNVHTLEELAALHDGQCQLLGHGTLTFRKAARDHLTLKLMQGKEAAHKAVMEASKTANPVKDDQASEGLSEIKDLLVEQNKNLSALIAVLTAPKKRKE